MPTVLFNLEITVPSVALQYDKKLTVKALRWGAAEVIRATRALLSSSVGGGKKYGKHRASLPGETPAKMTGMLSKSLRSRVRVQRNIIVARVVDIAAGSGRAGTQDRPYSKFLETGSVNAIRSPGSRARVHRYASFEQRKAGANGGSVQEPRPYLTAVLDKTRAAIQARIEEAVTKGLDLSIKPAKKKTTRTVRGSTTSAP